MGERLVYHAAEFKRSAQNGVLLKVINGVGCSSNRVGLLLQPRNRLCLAPAVSHFLVALWEAPAPNGANRHVAQNEVHC